MTMLVIIPYILDNRKLTVLSRLRQEDMARRKLFLQNPANNKSFPQVRGMPRRSSCHAFLTEEKTWCVKANDGLSWLLTIPDTMIRLLSVCCSTFCLPIHVHMSTEPKLDFQDIKSPWGLHLFLEMEISGKRLNAVASLSPLQSCLVWLRAPPYSRATACSTLATRRIRLIHAIFPTHMPHPGWKS